MLCVIGTLACVCLYVCGIFVCVCAYRTKLSGLRRKTLPPSSFTCSYILLTGLLPLPSSLLVKHIYNFHSSRTKTLDCLSFNSLSPASLLLSIFHSFNPSVCSSEAASSCVFHVTLLFMFTQRSASLSAALSCSFTASLVVFLWLFPTFSRHSFC